MFCRHKTISDDCSLGTRGERAAAEYLKTIGYSILDRNYSNRKGRRVGEIDIIAKDGQAIVFVEVKTRKLSSRSDAPLPEESIGRTKLHKLDKIANYYLITKGYRGLSYRFDAITVLADPESKTATLRHLKNIFI